MAGELLGYNEQLLKRAIKHGALIEIKVLEDD